LQGVRTEVLGDSKYSTLDNLVAGLRAGPDILYLVCHGRLVEGKPILYLQDDAGMVEPTPGVDLLTRLNDLAQLPRLVVLVSCQSASIDKDDLEADPQGALGPELAKLGIPAVLAMHGNVFMETAKTFMPVFFRELLRDGHIDRAVARARGDVRERADAWAPVLYMRLKSGSLWSEGGFLPDQAFGGWRTLIGHVNRGDCTPILGPGLTESLIGSRRDIARRWAKNYSFPMAPHDQDDLPQVGQFVSVNQGERREMLNDLEDSVRTWLLNQLGEDEPEKRQAEPVDSLILELGQRRWESNTDEPHWVLAQTPSKVFVTTTVDSLLVQALKAAGKDPRVELFQWNDYAQWPPSVYDADPGYVPSTEKPLVYHLFGRLGVMGSLVITEDDYFRYLVGYTRNRDVVPAVVRAAFVESALLFLGFEMHSWDFRVLFWSVMNNPGQYRSQDMGYAHVGVQIDLDESQILELEGARKYLESYLRGSNIRIFWGSVEEFTRELRKQQASLR
jgi:hypothetical protein